MRLSGDGRECLSLEMWRRMNDLSCNFCNASLYILLWDWPLLSPPIAKIFA